MTDPTTPEDPHHTAMFPAADAAVAPTGPTASERRWLTAAIVAAGTAVAFSLGGAIYAATELHADQQTQSVSGLLPLVPQQSPDATTTSTTATDASDEQEEGLVYINTVIDFGSGAGAGTGMILTSNGTILTNHHVIEGATSIEVEIVSTGETYEADVVGYDAESDVAVLQLQDASNLDTVDLDLSEDLDIGDTVTAVGNANGDGGAASAAEGTITGLDESITVQSTTGGASQLSDLIEIDADVVSGDSGGVVYDTDGEVIGMTTAASSGSADITGYAIDIKDAYTIAREIISGEASDTITIGDTAFLGISLDSRSDQPVVAGIIEGYAAEEAGITAGSTITAFDGTSVSTATDLSALIAEHAAGDTVSITWTDASGASQSAEVTLSAGPVG